ncbi:MAG: hypothetical protein HYT99_09330 [Candidatus Tectomicrobia bacterium]|nr:hypothetical protein [Candidatus Tectomicrobia bacterium]
MSTQKAGPTKLAALRGAIRPKPADHLICSCSEWKPSKRSRNARALAAGFQEAAVDVLVEKVERAARAQRLQAVSVSGGVASNRHLRERLAMKARATCARRRPRLGAGQPRRRRLGPERIENPCGRKKQAPPRSKRRWPRCRLLLRVFWRPWRSAGSA